MKWLLWLACLGAPAWAQEGVERDPTAWPPALRHALAASRAASAASGADDATAAAPIRHVVLQGGKAYVVVGSRRFGVGEQLDGARIQRIDEHAVWLQEGGRVRREPLYAGVEKKKPPDDRPAHPNSKEKP